MLPFLAAGAVFHLHKSVLDRTMPHSFIFSAFYLLIISSVQHKEARFILPITPYLLMMVGQLSSALMRIKYLGKLVALVLIAHSVYECTFHVASSEVTFPLHQSIDYIMTKDPEPHSIYA
jgi:hypothetical protein